MNCDNENVFLENIEYIIIVVEVIIQTQQSPEIMNWDS